MTGFCIVDLKGRLTKVSGWPLWYNWVSTAADEASESSSTRVVLAPSVSTPSASVASNSFEASPSTEKSSSEITSNPSWPNAADSNYYYFSSTPSYIEVVARTSVVIVEEVHLYMPQC